MLAPLLALLALPATLAGYACYDTTKAMVRLAGPGTANGTVYFTQQGGSDEVKITGQISGLSPGKHGFHVHAYGDIFTQGCTSTGGHYNPFNRTHGAPSDRVRHVGDLGNIEAGADGVSHLDFSDSTITLCGRRTILGRGVVVHDGEDDLGLGGFPDSKTTGHAGNRTACGIIAAVDPTK
ncbi:superoxide dismutase 1, soluble [Cutaneotrichosporon oleaginosum]|uniref:Superoxide dismutase [Cu-Zn] n=1 Tax=Cutaneotrichosporon oleaginosum TaxID=879819 RepID=A0A0J0XHD9_9TREE|nr:superoxide dismutase 1, soluble [Cutaneotrichosporon oleaginosum]KLT40422.1 superoxide dismutase 1, soluble [Cutaneotrichosporon oleaginosum]TXT11387.1 hypothetical protein COLE_01797 [Cutaneotrichosporon oleaginosum]